MTRLGIGARVVPAPGVANSRVSDVPGTVKERRPLTGLPTGRYQYLVVWDDEQCDYFEGNQLRRISKEQKANG